MPSTWNWKLLRAGSISLDGGGMFGVVPRTMWAELVQPDERNRIPLQTNCLLLDNGSKRVLVETGFGDKWSEKERDIWDLERRTVVDALREADVEPDAIDLVIVTHLHFDHAAAVTRLDGAGEAVPTFRNARLVVQRTEWEDALIGKTTMTRTYRHDSLDPVAGRLSLADGKQEIEPGLSVFPVPGHTWGQQAIRFDDGDGLVCFPGDVMPTIHHVHPSFSMSFDMMPFENMLTKKALLARAVEEDWRIVLAHETGNPVVRAETTGHSRFALHTV